MTSPPSPPGSPTPGPWERLLEAAKAVLEPGQGGRNEWAHYVPSKIYDPLKDAIAEAEEAIRKATGA